MKVDKDTLYKIAHLARLEIDPAKEDLLLRDLEELVSWVEKLKEIDTSGVEPLTSMTEELNRTRPDEQSNVLEKKKGLENGPDIDGEFFRVPKVLK